jgi:inorganic pyrophosphatase
MGTRPAFLGEVYQVINQLSTYSVRSFVAFQVRILGALAMIDEGEMDWKMLAIDVRDPIAQHIQGCDV